ncbi:MAG: adenosine deaminase [Actinobacteria bacterium]|nr:adenosine deaminase [Actinomycetota bacterium]
MTESNLHSLKKTVLHEHLDGSLRVPTLLDLADEYGYDGLPASDAAGLAASLHMGDSGSLSKYLEAFEYTIAVMQHEDAIARVAYENLEDLASEGVVYAEIRFGPSLHTAKGLDRSAVIEAVIDGFTRAQRDHGIVWGIIVDALRQDTDSETVADLAIRYADRGVVAFDLAGPEAGNPVRNYLPALRSAKEHGLGITIHAGEGDGVHSIWQAVALGAAQRIGHGVRIVEDCVVEDGEIVEVGSVARRIRDHRIPLEVCPTSNANTAIVATPDDHPLGMLHRAGFAVTLNTDNRLMSNITLTDEYELATRAFGFDEAIFNEMNRTALNGAFGDWSQRKTLIDEHFPA